MEEESFFSKITQHAIALNEDKIDLTKKIFLNMNKNGILIYFQEN